MSGVIRVREFGGPQVLKWEEANAVSPAAGEVLVRNLAVGLNFLDVYFRSGRYGIPLPFVPGHEGAGTVEAVGEGVSEFRAGDKVGYVDPIGAYATYVVRPANRLVKLPDFIDADVAASSLLKGMTAEYLIRRTYRVMPGEMILVHAAAGGVGQILCQWAASIGATVIGTVGREEKRALAEGAGCSHVIVTGVDDLVGRVRYLTGGKGVPVVYDGVGAETFEKSLDCLSPRGMMVAFGASSGPIPLLDVQSLAAKGSLYVTRPGIGSYTAGTELQDSAAALFEVIGSGSVRIASSRSYPLREAADAHADLEARKLTGSTVLIP